MTTTDRTLPHNLEAERALLGAALLRPEILDEALVIVRAEDFYREAHRRIFSQIVALHGQKVEPDLVTVKNALLAAGELDQVGGPVYLAELLDGVPRSTNIAHYAGIVKEKARLRATIFTAQRMYESAFEHEDAKHLIDQAEAALLAIATQSESAGFRRLSTILPGVLDQIERWAADGGGITGLPTRFRDLDAMTRGLQPGNLIVLAARPAMGKSALASNIAKQVAAQNHPVGLVSLEMAAEELAVRSIADEGGVDSHWLQRGRLDQRAWGRLTHALGVLEGLPLFIDDAPFQTEYDVRTRARRLKAEHGLDLLVVDYAQLMRSAEKVDNRALEVGHISRALKGLAKELHIPVIALSQLSRKVEERQHHRPMLSDLRESGALEQDADMVWFLYRPVVYDDTPKGEFSQMDPAEYATYTELIIAKQRNGPIGMVPLTWTAEYTRFSDRDRADRATQQALPTGDR